MSESEYLSLTDVLQRLKQWKLGCVFFIFLWLLISLISPQRHGTVGVVYFKLFFKFMDERSAQSSFFLYFYSKFIERI